jgi:hypothetical protein
MRLFSSPKLKWIFIVVFLALLFFLFVYHNSQLWNKVVNLYDIVNDRHQLKGIIRA